MKFGSKRSKPPAAVLDGKSNKSTGMELTGALIYYVLVKNYINHIDIIYTGYR